jgi:release factor glutamine methyltransferase
VEETIAAVKKNKINNIADIGTGSGAIAVSLAVQLPGAKIYATDISSKALEVAEQNCKKHNVEDRIVLLQGNLLEPLKKGVDIIAANLPYVRQSDLQTQKELTYEPQEALDGGRDGLDVIRNFCKQAEEKRNMFKFLLLEIGRGQSERIIAILSEIYPEGSIEVFRDMAGIERIVSLSLTQAREF